VTGGERDGWGGGEDEGFERIQQAREELQLLARGTENGIWVKTSEWVVVGKGLSGLAQDRVAQALRLRGTGRWEMGWGRRSTHSLDRIRHN
jgi:hypothetical protein